MIEIEEGWPWCGKMADEESATNEVRELVSQLFGGLAHRIVVVSRSE